MVLLSVCFVTRPGEMKRPGTQIEAGKSMDADMIRAREKLVASPQMTELLNLVDTIETVDPVEVRYTRCFFQSMSPCV